MLVGADRATAGEVDPAIALRPPPLESGDTGRWVRRLQRELTRLNLYRGTLDGNYGTETAYAVMAYHKVAGLDPTFDWRGEDWDLLATWKVEGILERHPDEPDRVEVDIGR
ncbi:MAG TPA: peptidoglycan-binding domain-containing protein, partial [Acidimicrobiia bacterium]|nr:peptidoglycan-binding domain-containing protein [Acidimicrobiia bacterium]